MSSVQHRFYIYWNVFGFTCYAVHLSVIVAYYKSNEEEDGQVSKLKLTFIKQNKLR